MSKLADVCIPASVVFAGLGPCPEPLSKVVCFSCMNGCKYCKRFLNRVSDRLGSEAGGMNGKLTQMC